MAALLDGGYLSDAGLAHRSEVLSLLKDTQASVAEAETPRSDAYFGQTGPQPAAGYQSLANRLERLGYLSLGGLNLHQGA